MFSWQRLLRMLEEGVADEVEDFAFPLAEIVGRVGVEIAQELQHVGGGEVKDDEGSDGDGSVEGVGFAEFAGAHAAGEKFVEGLGAGGEVFFDEVFEGLSAGGHELLEERGVAVALADEIKVQVDVLEEDFSGRGRFGGGCRGPGG